MPSKRQQLLGARWVMTAAFLASSLSSAGVGAQSFFYNEVAKDGRIYVFAERSKYEAFMKTGGIDGQVNERSAYGPSGETVVFDSARAINLYNFTHGLPGESVVTANEPTPSEFPTGKFSGLMFGDYYWYYKRHQDQVSTDNPTPVQGQHGLWFRRIYFSYDFAYSEKLRTRFRLEAASSGDFTGGDIVPLIKDAYLSWSFKGRQQLTLGIQPTVTFDWLDGFWGLRHIEKTPADLYRLDASRDFGVTLSGPMKRSGLRYGIQFGNESGNGSETQEGKILRIENRYERNPGIALEGFYSFARRPSAEDRQTIQGVGGFQNAVARVAAQYMWQQRRSGQTDVPDQTITVWSGFAVWNVRPQLVDLFFRLDHVTGDLGGVETGLPGAEDIDYWLLSSQSPLTAWIVGGERYLHPNVRLSPNLEVVRYAHDPDPSNFPARRRDSILRLTFFWSF